MTKKFFLETRAHFFQPSAYVDNIQLKYSSGNTKSFNSFPKTFERYIYRGRSYQTFLFIPDYAIVRVLSFSFSLFSFFPAENFLRLLREKESLANEKLSQFLMRNLH